MNSNKAGYSAIVMLSMTFLGVGMFLSRGWLNDFQRFVKDKVGGGDSSTPTGNASGLGPGAAQGDPHAGNTQGGGGSW